MPRLRPWLFIPLILATACSRAYTSAASSEKVEFVEVARSQSADRLFIQRADVRLRVDDPAQVHPRVQSYVERAGGHMEATMAEEGLTTLIIRIPSAQLNAFLDTTEQWGDVREKRVTSEDVTEESFDMDARIRNLTAVRDRLRTYLDRAGEIPDIIAVERELSRVQSELEGLEGRRDRLQTDVAYSRVHLQLERRRVLGPLGAILAGVGMLISKLFVIR